MSRKGFAKRFLPSPSPAGASLVVLDLVAEPPRAALRRPWFGWRQTSPERVWRGTPPLYSRLREGEFERRELPLPPLGRTELRRALALGTFADQLFADLAEDPHQGIGWLAKGLGSDTPRLTGVQVSAEAIAGHRRLAAERGAELVGLWAGQVPLKCLSPGPGARDSISINLVEVRRHPAPSIALLVATGLLAGGLALVPVLFAPPAPDRAATAAALESRRAALATARARLTALRSAPDNQVFSLARLRAVATAAVRPRALNLYRFEADGDLRLEGMVADEEEALRYLEALQSLAADGLRLVQLEAADNGLFRFVIRGPLPAPEAGA